MNQPNPYQSPDSCSTELAGVGVERVSGPPYGRTVALLFIAGCFSLLLNGQVFTNALVCVGCLTLSSAFWIRFLQTRPNPTQWRRGLGILVVHWLLIIAALVALPDHHRRQKQFNHMINELKQRNANPTP